MKTNSVAYNMVLIAFVIITSVYGANLIVSNEKRMNMYISSMADAHRAEFQSKQLTDSTDIEHIKLYNTISIDNGKTWYEVDDNKQILGIFDVRHPGLRDKMEAHHKALEKLCDYAKAHGPITGATMSGEEYKLLKDCKLVK